MPTWPDFRDAPDLREMDNAREMTSEAIQSQYAASARVLALAEDRKEYCFIEIR
mgnify:CR=1 FL=1